MKNNKSKIREILRENIFTAIKEEGAPEPSTHSQNHSNTYEKDYSELERKLDGTMLKASQVMAASGLGDPDNATDRSLFSKKLRREKNDEGGLYQFDEKELASIIKVINNPTAYLTSKRG